MTNHLVFCAFTVLALTCCLQVQAHASPSGSLIQHLSSLLKWRRSNSKTPQSDGNVLQFENGYVVLKEMILGSFLIGSVFLPKMVIAIISLVQYLLQHADWDIVFDPYYSFQGDYCIMQKKRDEITTSSELFID
ncbi:uncharacterized protein LOC111241293 isoform X2 [Vigna radiata var. radiata]|uniref:Uncharacterized protein LOC111241293 isoform X2 n=1 Tax=Vigna radiata var. radiata TaxID=3916 RepID=A0A3Q0ERZ9_VIGRR|nr:uncharacterized protein LOC111241293 isoform X2 [Vigna radiata var. radiata]